MPKILTIEDSAFERRVIVDMLHKAGYKDVIEAADGEEGLKVYEKEKPDMVLLDLRMPGMPGLEVLKKLKEKYAKVIVVIVSIVRKEETIKEATALGAVDYVVKPVTKEKLIPAVKKALGG